MFSEVLSYVGNGLSATFSHYEAGNEVFIRNINDSQIIEIAVSPFKIGFGTVLEVHSLEGLSKLKFKKASMGVLTLTFKSEHTIQYLFKDSKECVDFLKLQMQQLGLKGDVTKSLNDAKHVANANSFYEATKEIEQRFSLNPSYKLIEKVMDLLREAAEQFAEGSDDRYLKVITHIQKFLQRADVTRILDDTVNKSSIKLPNDKGDPDLNEIIFNDNGNNESINEINNNVDNNNGNNNGNNCDSKLSFDLYIPLLELKKVHPNPNSSPTFRTSNTYESTLNSDMNLISGSEESNVISKDNYGGNLNPNFDPNFKFNPTLDFEHNQSNSNALKFQLDVDEMLRFEEEMASLMFKTEETSPRSPRSLDPDSDTNFEFFSFQSNKSNESDKIEGELNSMLGDITNEFTNLLDSFQSNNSEADNNNENKDDFNKIKRIETLDSEFSIDDCDSLLLG